MKRECTSGVLLFFFAVSRCSSLLLLAVSRCYFTAAIAKSRGFPRLSSAGPLFFLGKNSEKQRRLAVAPVLP
jgi:hypothetical protein